MRVAVILLLSKEYPDSERLLHESQMSERGMTR
jgi:hypothetical protein